ncbi:mitochondrial carrier protein [Nannizzia gypsea CBS 118893]|uniref:Mitochondrial carrier protein n=1 Tax=Arthroderma gypseum (strain ATCC MYA-4604 / CBS 118893) TaxID=535722 RepID=E4UZ01_ARTGP|nr:mitochondrial carrier protein [Nannizzia gypsea CBS 118893]EFR03331.1 mitochondrial carrier protein [Nannizzia gypsea CBS 118893]
MSIPIDSPGQLKASHPKVGNDEPDGDGTGRRKPRTNAATGASAAGMRAISAQAIAFYFRTPVKAFFRTRVDYMALAKAIGPQTTTGGWSWKTTTPGLLANAVQTHGWVFIPYQVLPPLIANVGVGAILYTSYLQILGAMHEPTLMGGKRVYPPPSPPVTFFAGFAAGAIQSIAAAPLDAIQARSRTSDMINGQYRSAWHYGWDKLKTLGARGVFSGWTLSFLKDSFGSAVFFSLFETVKAQGYYHFITRYYGSLKAQSIQILSSPTAPGEIPVIKPHYALEPAFLMLAGITATIFQQAVLHPLSLVQNIYYRNLDHLDKRVRHSRSGREMMEHRANAYMETFKKCQRQARRVGGWRTWLYGGFFMNTLRQLPSTSAGLIIFELVRRKYGVPTEAVHIQLDGYDIILT